MLHRGPDHRPGPPARGLRHVPARAERAPCGRGARSGRGAGRAAALRRVRRGEAEPGAAGPGAGAGPAGPGGGGPVGPAGRLPGRAGRPAALSRAGQGHPAPPGQGLGGGAPVWFRSGERFPLVMPASPGGSVVDQSLLRQAADRGVTICFADLDGADGLWVPEERTVLVNRGLSEREGRRGHRARARPRHDRRPARRPGRRQGGAAGRRPRRPAGGRPRRWPRPPAWSPSSAA